MGKGISNKKGVNFKFLDFCLLDAVFHVNREFKAAEGENIEIATDFNLGHKTTEKRVQVFLKVTSDGKKAPFSFIVEGAGFFEFEEVQEEGDMARIAGINCAAIIFPYIRETVADLTRRAGFPPLHLAPVNFVEAFKVKKD
ncbi:MAG: protein-export chaperone SecB [bacterium]|nr:protein-export chaperone SecB [bacterium]